MIETEGVLQHALTMLSGPGGPTLQHSEVRVSRDESRARHELSLQLFGEICACQRSGNQDGWMAAREQLFRLYEKQAISFAQWLARRQKNSPALAEDVCQEARLAVLTAARDWEPRRGEFLTLLMYHVRTRINALLCREGRRPGIINEQDGCQSLDDLNLSVNFLDWGLPDPVDRIDLRLQEIAIRSAVETLPAPEREAVEWRYGLKDGRFRTYREVGEVLLCSHVAVQKRVDSALPKLAALLSA